MGHAETSPSRADGIGRFHAVDKRKSRTRHSGRVAGYKLGIIVRRVQWFRSSAGSCNVRHRRRAGVAHACSPLPGSVEVAPKGLQQTVEGHEGVLPNKALEPFAALTRTVKPLRGLPAAQRRRSASIFMK